MRKFMSFSIIGLMMACSTYAFTAEPNGPATAPCATQPLQELKILEAQIKEVEARISETDEPSRRIADRVRQLKILQKTTTTQSSSTSKPVDRSRVELDQELQAATAEQRSLWRRRNELENQKWDLLIKHYNLADTIENPYPNIVYLVDCSGTMLEIFDFIKADLIRRINKLTPERNFHVIYFTTGMPKENPSQRLIPATPENKQIAADFLRDIVPEGETNPAKALARAFQVTDEKGEKAQVIYMYTDGIFPPHIASYIRKLNVDNKMKINTISFIADENRKLLEKIAKDNGGKYRFVQQDELGR